MRISDWSSDVCASDLQKVDAALRRAAIKMAKEQRIQRGLDKTARNNLIQAQAGQDGIKLLRGFLHRANFEPRKDGHGWVRSEERRVGKACVSNLSSRWTTYH